VGSATEVSLYVYCVTTGTRFWYLQQEDWIPLLEGATTSTRPAIPVGVVNRHGLGWRRGPAYWGKHARLRVSYDLYMVCLWLFLNTHDVLGRC